MKIRFFASSVFLVLLLQMQVVQAQTGNPHKLIINRITRGNRICNRIYNNFPVKSHREFLNRNCKKWGLGRAVDLVTGDKQQIYLNLK